MAVVFLSYLGNRGSSTEAAPSKQESASFPPVKYRLAIPRTLLDGEYMLIEDNSQETDAEIGRSGSGIHPEARNVKAAAGSYNGTSKVSHSGLVVTGMYGQFKNPEQQRYGLMDGLRKAEGMSEPKPPQHITPQGSEVDFECTVMMSEDPEGTATIPVCAWGDDNTAAYVAFVTPASAEQHPESVDLDQIAQKVLEIRRDMRQQIS
ncbi:hypothetical protein QCN29_28985 [Streptomyces sp. HNM0663]|uniref:Uncharacterized protein n=1 Tax=Streptomyces chengmaiensis TaxID=3040919 RepID=A0ABT6HVM4_9ACTN|nr:hypothetical protein [Streptomyces chengmaiensis]MDH2392745.1 hypothetical protein [Streptomyces chengmaiensis]